MNYRFSFMAAAAVFFLSTSIASSAEKLPRDAKPLSAEETKAMWSGKTVNWKPAKMYFSPDGTVVGIYPVKGKEGFSEGTWQSSDNRVCYKATWKSAAKKSVVDEDDVCFEFFKSKNDIWTKNVKNDPKRQGTVFSGIDDKLTAGDTASKQAMAFKAK